jgi:hypothetical protein
MATCESWRWPPSALVDSPSRADGLTAAQEREMRAVAVACISNMAQRVYEDK